MSAVVGTAWLALDIGAQSYAWAGEYQGKVWSGSVEASTAQVRGLVKDWLQKGPVHVIMEATGIYYLDAALIADDLGATVTVINPKTAHHFAKALGGATRLTGLMRPCCSTASSACRTHLGRARARRR